MAVSSELHLKSGEVVLANGVARRATDGTETTIVTNVRITVQDNGFLRIAFECLSDTWVNENTYTGYNTDLWKQEVFEVFVAAGSEQSGRYLEIELNPNNALFAAWVENPSGEDVTLLTKIGYEEAGIGHKVEVGDGKWAGELTIPLQLIGEGPVYRINFYRIVLTTEPEVTGDWECSTDNCEFLCWQPTLSGNEPAFHRPARFGYLYLDK